MKPTVTKLIDLLNKPALLEWANKLGLSGVSLKDYRRSSTSEGTRNHKDVEQGTLPYHKRVIYDHWASNKTIIARELEISHKWFYGRADMVYKSNDTGELFVVDFKSTEKMYLATSLQLTAYCLALGDEYIGEVVSYNSYMSTRLTKASRDKCEKILEHLYEIYQLTEGNL